MLQTYMYVQQLVNDEVDDDVIYTDCIKLIFFLRDTRFIAAAFCKLFVKIDRIPAGNIFWTSERAGYP